MTRAEALEVANVLVEAWTEQKLNGRGYVHDKWQPVDLKTRTEAVLAVAEWLLGPSAKLTAPETPVGVTEGTT